MALRKDDRKDTVKKVLSAKATRGTNEIKYNLEFEGGRTEWVLESRVNTATKALAKRQGIVV